MRLHPFSSWGALGSHSEFSDSRTRKDYAAWRSAGSYRCFLKCRPQWYRTAATVLRGGDGGEHGRLLYKLVLGMSSQRGGRLVVLDVGTARGFSAIAMARAMLDGELEGRSLLGGRDRA